MGENDYYDEFLDDEDLPLKKAAKEVLPSWVTDKNSSYAAYRAILSLEQDKKSYIRTHKLKSQYGKKSNYQINKSEVAKIVNKNAQPLFNSNSYSGKLSDFFNDINKVLNEAKERKVDSKVGLQSKRKEDLIVEHKELIKSHANSQHKAVDELYQRLIGNMPLDVKRKLKVG